jgi:serine/threonine protein phosphatase PrpC
MIRRVFDVDSCGLSHAGRVRELNEDRYLVKSESGVFAVADGMGGHEAGELASSSIVEHLKSIGVPSSAPDLRARFEDRVMNANREIREISSARNGAVIGSTLAALLAFESQYACMWAGDSRIYRLRAGALSQLSRDHTEVQQLLDEGVLSREEAAHWPRRNVITRAIGALEDPPLDIAHGQILPDDKFLICSDGLTAHVSDDEIRDRLQQGDARQACQSLIDLTLSRGGTDNVTVVVVQFRTAAAVGKTFGWAAGSSQDLSEHAV